MYYSLLFLQRLTLFKLSPKAFQKWLLAHLSSVSLHPQFPYLTRHFDWDRVQPTFHKLHIYRLNYSCYVDFRRFKGPARRKTIKSGSRNVTGIQIEWLDIEKLRHTFWKRAPPPHHLRLLNSIRDNFAATPEQIYGSGNDSGGNAIVCRYVSVGCKRSLSCSKQ